MSGRPSWALLTASYLLLAAAGATAMVWPSPSVEQQGGRSWAAVWAVLLVVGGAVSAFGAARHAYRWEYAGLPPLIAVWTVYFVASMAAVATGLMERLPGALALAAVACFLGARWREVAHVRIAARQVAERHTH